MAEMIVVISIIGVLSLLAFSALTNVTGSSEAVKDKRNAQMIARTASSAIAAGVEEICDCDDVVEAIASLESGVSPGGEMSSLVFKIPPMKEEEKKGAANYLVYAEGMLIYSP